MINNVMDSIFDWVNQIANNPDSLDPVIPIIPSHSDIPAPSGIYITINYMPVIRTVGQADYEVKEEAGVVYKILRNDIEATVEIWETNGTGESLLKLVNQQWVDEVVQFLSAKNISVLRNNDIVQIPSIQPDDKWQRECVVEFVFGFGAGMKYESGSIDKIEADGALVKADGTERDVTIR